ncbi:NUDIX domain-containing protein [Rathayibacter sp. VKM Ac-2760]|nr:NUDIX domain-containing protein [Rathayibacter sp. VKM Ac-2760]
MSAQLAEWAAPPALAGLRDEYLAFADERGASALERGGGPEHITASCFVLSPDLERVLLCYHRKGRFWVQLGGHVEPADASVPATAEREAREESGIEALTLRSPVPVDLDRHGLGGGFGRCTTHWDVGYAAVVDPAVPLVVSDESDALAWWPVAALPAEIPPRFDRRLAGALAGVRRL